jgi:hypothetical protein
LLLLLEIRNWLINESKEVIYQLVLITPLQHLGYIDSRVFIEVDRQELTYLVFIDHFSLAYHFVTSIAAGYQHEFNVHQRKTVEFVEVE